MTPSSVESVAKHTPVHGTRTSHGSGDASAQEEKVSLDGYTEPLRIVQNATLEIQKAGLEIQKMALKANGFDLQNQLVIIQLAAVDLLRSGMAVAREVLTHIPAGSGTAEDASIYCEAAITLLSEGRAFEAVPYFRHAIGMRSDYAVAHKGLADAYLQLGQPVLAISSYREALIIQTEFPEAENNLALAHLATYNHLEAQKTFHRILFREHGLADEKRRKFNAANYSEPDKDHYASPFKLVDRTDQLMYLLKLGKIDASFEHLVTAYRQLLDEIKNDKDRVPYSPLTERQLQSFRGYYDKIIYHCDAPRLVGPALNPELDYEGIEKEYLRTRTLYFDNFLTPEALSALRNFFMVSTIFFRHSEAGFVGSYVTDGFSCNLVFQIIDELRQRLPRLLADKPLNNMWCYRYDRQGAGVRPHNGDGSVTINFYLTPDDANIGPPNGGGMVMYDKEHPPHWDWLTFNMKKDDPDIQAQIADYLTDAKSLVIPYRCNRAVLFHSTLFHKTDPFQFRDDYESRRMNITMLFGRRGQESAALR